MKTLIAAMILLAANSPGFAQQSGDPCIDELTAMAQKLEQMNNDPATTDDEKIRFANEIQAKTQQCLNETSSPPDSNSATTGVLDPSNPSVRDAVAPAAPDSTKENADAAKQAARDIGKETADFVKNIKEAAEPPQGPSALAKGFDLLSAAASGANTALRGDIPTTIAAIGMLQSISKGQSDMLDALGSRSENDWMVISGYSIGNNPTVTEAKDKLDQIYNRLQTISNLDSGILPALRTAQRVLANGGSAAMAAINANSMPLGDPDALEQVINELSGYPTMISKIQARLRRVEANIQVVNIDNQ